MGWLIGLVVLMYWISDFGFFELGRREEEVVEEEEREGGDVICYMCLFFYCQVRKWRV
ncbi:hypothetical protein BofuT4_uP016870.1 [Botrytis cinerea T4]|uniref:Uncharacterized protein n=1 Tax=Botryotinia fuckeliana (strain T4) TaxID=999810 RepID=G2YI44_BOTF4|nr:hypothetical protein BofuT4_uP016870.1 [Botrytis cinerea T4]